MKTYLSLLVLLFVHLHLCTKLFAQTPSHDIVKYGAVGDGKTINTNAIQAAIDSTSIKGGGTVYIPSGVFLTGTLHFRSNITLFLEAGAVLKGSPNMEDYPDGLGLLYGEDLTNIAIKGQGEINGSGSEFMEWGTLHFYIDFDRSRLRQGEDFLKGLTGAGEGPVGYSQRPNMMIIFMHCENVTIENVRLTNAPNWTARIGNCENVLVRGVSVLNNEMIPNSDGFHFTTSRSVRVSDCNIVAGDDALVVTGFGPEIDVNGRRTNEVRADYQYGNKSGVAEDIVVSNCILSSRSAGIRIGYGDNDMRNCLFQNIIIRNSNRGVGLFTRDPGSIENIMFSNFIIETRLYKGTWWGRGEPVHISSISQQKGQDAGTIRNITFQNFEIKSESGIVVYGEKPEAIKDITFENFDILIKKGAHADDGGNIDLRPTASLETNLFKRDLPGIYVNNANDIKIKEMNLKWGDDLPAYFTHALEVANFSMLHIEGFTGRQAGESGSTIALHNGKKVYIQACVADEGTDIFLKLTDVLQRSTFSNNDLRAAKTAISPAKAKFDIRE